MRRWHFIHAEGHKVIFASPEVVDFVRATLSRRDAEVIEEKERDEAWVDNPGMCLVNRKLWEGTVAGLKVEIPVSDFHDFLRQVKEHLGDASFNSDNDPDRGYRSIYGWHHCITLTQEQYEELHATMVQDADAVQALADEEIDHLSKAIRRANDELKASGSAVAIDSPRLRLAETKGPLGGKWN